MSVGFTSNSNDCTNLLRYNEPTRPIAKPTNRRSYQVLHALQRSSKQATLSDIRASTRNCFTSRAQCPLECGRMNTTVLACQHKWLWSFSFQEKAERNLSAGWRFWFSE